ncbi:CCN family member 5 [Pleurodeles waltl]|uniref:CCN family member 5 n=1 Tax=Pleurodeles waltl TaxID=8319 RepID=UPI0037098554
MSQPNKKCELQRVLVFISILCILSKVCAQLCREQCYCPWVPPRCAPGVPLVLDGCGCCRICARQYGEACNQVYVCHHEQGLFCDYSAGYMGKGGLCNDEEDGNCEIDGKTYKNGEVFQPTCKMQCVCSDGGVTCTPLCSDNIQLPTSECPSPRRVQLPGKCCDQWICDQQQNRITNDAQSVYRQLEVAPQTLFYKCEEWSSEWSACSTSCGIGISLRVSNTNPHCRLETQSRLCIVRPCHEYRTSRCKPTIKTSTWIRVEFQDCISIQAYQPTFCGYCGGRPCLPHQTTDNWVGFRCNGGRNTMENMMFVISCACH